VTELEANPEVPRLEDVTERLLHEEFKRKDKETSVVEVKAMTSKHRTSRKGPKCHHCGTFGHIKRDCRGLVENSGNSQDNGPTNNGTNKSFRKEKAYTVKEETNGEQEEIVGLVAEHVTR